MKRKRSEMVKVIEKAMRCWNGAYYNQSLESHILEYIEEAGMLPPLANEYPYLHKYGETYVNSKDLTWGPEEDA